VSLGVVGDVFEVMAQVDRRLTKVNSVDRIIRVDKLGRKPGASQQHPPLLKRSRPRLYYVNVAWHVHISSCRNKLILQKTHLDLKNELIQSIKKPESLEPNCMSTVIKTTSKCHKTWLFLPT
jgi:hypothetical protein